MATIPDVATLPGATFDCHACGACCRALTPGPVPAETLDALRSRDAGALVPGLDGEPFWELQERGEADAAFFRKVDGACIFLGPDNLCRIHAAFGAAAKPWFCRLFPYALVAGPEGLRLGWTPGCHSRHRTDGPATPLSESVAGLMEDAEHIPFRAVSPAGLSLPAGVPLPPAAYPAVERALLREIGRARPDFDGVFPALRSVLQAVSRTLPATDESERDWTQEATPLDWLLEAFELAADGVCAAFPDSDESRAASGVGDLLRASGDAGALAPDAARFLVEELANYVFTGGVSQHQGLAEGFGAFLFPALACRGSAAGALAQPVEASTLNAAWAVCHLGIGWWSQFAELESSQAAFAELFLAFES